MNDAVASEEVREPQIVSVMVGTAGHVDHGKTSLVKLLTGCDTDRLPEEKRRGMSIDLGFAPCLLKGKRMVGIIDVPGHEDFIKNMVAGASSMDVLMLVIAADDGVMPQAIEHLKVVSLLRMPKVLAVVTKIDLVAPSRCEEVRREIGAFLESYGFQNAPVLFVSNRTGEGVSEVRETIGRLAAEGSGKECDGPFRMPVERVFSVPGYGTVVAGIPVTGRCRIGDPLELLPGRKTAVVRAIQRYKRESEETGAHVCSALNLRNLRVEDIERGMTIASPGIYGETCSAVLSVRNVHESKAIKRRGEMHFHYGTSQRTVSCLLAGSDKLEPGQEGFMRIRTGAPMALAAGDRFILRSLSPAATVAGGVVLSVRAEVRRKRSPGENERLQKAASAARNGDFFLSELEAGNSMSVSRRDLASLIRGENGRIEQVIGEKEKDGVLLALDGSTWLIAGWKEEMEQRISVFLKRYYQRNKYSRGMPAEEVCAALGLERSCFEALTKIFASSEILAPLPGGISLKGYKPPLSLQQQKLRDGIVAKITAAGRAGMARGDLQAALGASDAEMQVLLRLLFEEEAILAVDYFLIHPAIVRGCWEKLLELFGQCEIVELAAFRQATGMSRNLAVAILDLFDARGLTRREGKGRKLLNSGNQKLPIRFVRG